MLAAIVQFSLRGASVAPVCAKYGPVQHMRRFQYVVDAQASPFFRRRVSCTAGACAN
jgi:hypothetical protein